VFKSTHHSWSYERKKREWVFFAEHSVVSNNFNLSKLVDYN